MFEGRGTVSESEAAHSTIQRLRLTDLRLAEVVLVISPQSK